MTDWDGELAPGDVLSLKDVPQELIVVLLAENQVKGSPDHRDWRTLVLADGLFPEHVGTIVTHLVVPRFWLNLGRESLP